MTTREAYGEFIQNISGIYDQREAKSIARWVFQYLFNFPPHKLTLKENNKIADIQLSALENVTKRLLMNEPLQYILGETEFYGMNFIVSPAVLIPRPETEELVYWVVNDFHQSSSDFERDQSRKVMDIGTGSGCIAITLKKHVPMATVIGLDVSRDALRVAEENALKNNVILEFIHQDILNEGHWPSLPEVDIIVSNPPYISYDEKHAMPANVVRFEPEQALFVDAKDPLLFYKIIGKLAMQKLSPAGKLYFEVHENHGEKVREWLMNNGFQHVILKKDLSGKYRMIRATL